jgi:hypothetical protein
MFHVGDEVYSGRFGEGIVTDVDNNDLYIYPIHVQWKDSCKRSIFTPEGRYNISFNDPDVDICILKVGKFKVGDHVYSKHFGEGVVKHIDDPKTNTYPVQVYWIGACPRSFNSCEFYTPDGKFNKLYPQPDNDIIHMFKLTDRVFYPYYGRGTVVGDFKTDVPYPIRVFWDKPYFADEPYSSFTRDGRMSLHMIDGDENFKLMLLKDIPKEETGESEVGQIAGVINYDIAKKMHEDEEKRSVEGKKFKVGERVWSPYFGGGVVTKNEAADNFPIEVHWDDGHLGDYDFFMADGKFNESGTHPEMGIYHIDPEYAAKVLPDIMKELADEDDEGTVERMEDALNKKTEDAVNPAHYKVEGLPEAIDIINHLMHREQYEGFLWGNILKYAYRYGRKGGKAETAGKIAWYANQLKDLAEEGDKK